MSYCSHAFIVFLLLLATSYALPRRTRATNTTKPNIPGLDHLRSGFDASKMVSGDELAASINDKTKFRIFNFDTELGPEFVLQTLGQYHTYTTPAVVQVTDMSIRTENYCEEIVKTFREFYRRHFESTSFSAGINIESENIQAGLGYSRLLEQVYHEITNYSQAVGISSSWWGMYSMTLGPAFLIPYDPLFNRTMQELKKIQPPITEAHQTIFNGVINSFGTHYVTSVIVGAQASSYTFLSNSYHTATAYRRMEEQISIKFQIDKLNLAGDHNTGDLENSLTEDFKKNSKNHIVFHPPVKDVASKPQWNAWLDTASQQPVVVNRTLARLSDLFTDSPLVQTHLQKTIDYYVLHGITPTLQQLQ